MTTLLPQLPADALSVFRHQPDIDDRQPRRYCRADATCQRLAAAVGAGNRTWRAYLSVSRDPANNNQPANARDRIGTGPWYNAAGVLVANNLAELHAPHW